MPNQELDALTGRFLDPQARKVLATPEADGSVTLVPAPDLQVDGEGRLLHLELTEHSRTNANLVRALWFSRTYTVLLESPDGRSFQLRGEPYKALVAGPAFEGWYRHVKERKDGTSLSTAWLLDVNEIQEQTPDVRHRRDEEGRIPLVHLDQIARTGISIEVNA
jgi:hypothetical protein